MVDMYKDTFLTVYASVWQKGVWTIKGGEKVPHKSIPAAREYALSRGYKGIRVSLPKKPFGLHHRKR